MPSAQIEISKKYSWTSRMDSRKNGLWKKEFGATEAEARAAMLIYLLENNLITADEVNNRLK